MNTFVAANMISALIFVVSLFGVIDWAVASVIMIVGVSLSTFIGSFYYSRKLINGTIYRLIFSIGLISTGYMIFKLGEYLNEAVYDGFILLSVLVYVLLMTVLLYFVGRTSTEK